MAAHEVDFAPGAVMDEAAVLDVLRRLDGLPLWLAGGVAIDFHVGRWTRDHHDIDLVAFADDRATITAALLARGFEPQRDRGWITNWTGGMSIAFEDRVDATTGNLVVRDASDGVVPGIYPGVPGNLDPDRWRSLGGRPPPAHRSTPSARTPRRAACTAVRG